MDNLQELLSKIEGAPQETDRGELEKWLKSQDSQIGKMQQSISKTSERYAELKEKRELVEQALKILRREAETERRTAEKSKSGWTRAKGNQPECFRNRKSFCCRR